MSSTKRLSVRIIRTVIIGLFLSALVVATLHLHVHTLPEVLDGIINKESTPPFPESAVKTVTYIFDQLGLLLPFLAVLILQYAIHRPFDRHDGKVQREMAWEILLIAAVSFGGLLPYVAHRSNQELNAALAAGEPFPTREGGAYDTLLLNLVAWFLRLAIGLGILYLYHSMRAKREADEAAAAAASPNPTENEEQA